MEAGAVVGRRFDVLFTCHDKVNPNGRYDYYQTADHAENKGIIVLLHLDIRIIYGGLCLIADPYSPCAFGLEAPSPGRGAQHGTDDNPPLL